MTDATKQGGEGMETLREAAKQAAERMGVTESRQPYRVAPFASPPRMQVQDRVCPRCRAPLSQSEIEIRYLAGWLCDGCFAAEQRGQRAAKVESQLPVNFRWASFDARDLAGRVSSPMAIARARTSQDASSVVLTGVAASGKTSLACCLLRAAFVDHGRSIRIEPAWRLASARQRHPLGEGEPECVREAIAVDVLCLDDLGSEKPNPTSAIEDVIFERHWQGRRTIYTTWMTVAQVQQRYGDGIARRVFERAVMIDCGGK